MKYLITDTVPDHARHYLTPNKKYPILTMPDGERHVTISDDNGKVRLMGVKASSDLDGGDWTVVEAGADSPPQTMKKHTHAQTTLTRLGVTAGKKYKIDEWVSVDTFRITDDYGLLSTFGVSGWKFTTPEEGQRESPPTDDCDVPVTPEEGHPHAENMLEYAKDAQKHRRPWKLWQSRSKDGGAPWGNCVTTPRWFPSSEYRRVPQVSKIGNHEYPKAETVAPADGAHCWCPSVDMGDTIAGFRYYRASSSDVNTLKRGFLHLTRENAVKHAEAILAAMEDGRSA